MADPGASAVLFFGCWDRVGHGFYDQHGGTVYPPPSPWGNGVDSLHHHGGNVPQGTLHVAQRGGWTVLDVTDRTVDSRPGSHSAFLAPGRLTEQQMLVLAWAVYPTIAQRIGLAAPDASADSVTTEP